MQIGRWMMVLRRCVGFECFVTMVDCVPIEWEEFVSCCCPSVVPQDAFVVVAIAEREVELNRLMMVLDFEIRHFELVGCCSFSSMVLGSPALDWRISRAQNRTNVHSRIDCVWALAWLVRFSRSW